MASCRSSSEDNIPVIARSNKSRSIEPKGILKKGRNQQFGKNEAMKDRRIIRSRSSGAYKKNQSENMNSNCDKSVQRNKPVAPNTQNNSTVRSRHQSQDARYYTASHDQSGEAQFHPKTRSIDLQRTYYDGRFDDISHFTNDVNLSNPSDNLILLKEANNSSSRNAIQIRSRPQTPPTDAFMKNPLRPNTRGNMCKGHSSSKNLIKLPLSSGREIPLPNSSYQSLNNLKQFNPSIYPTNKSNFGQCHQTRKDNSPYQVMVNSKRNAYQLSLLV